MEIILKQINELTPYENNPRKNDKSVNAVANSIKQFGFKVPIIIDGDGVIVAGHTRYKAAVKLKLDTVPCIVADDLTEEQIKAFRIADNKVGEMSEWDMDLLADELSDILDIDMSDFDMLDDEFEEIQAKHKKAKEQTDFADINFLNTGYGIYEGTGKYDIPIIKPVYELPEIREWIGFNYVLSDKDPAGKAVHFFLDDYQFERLWNRPKQYIDKLRQYVCVCSPDFSPMPHMPFATQIFNHYRKHWVAAFLQENGVTVIPTVRAASDEKSFEYAFEGEPQESIVMYSAQWTQNKDNREISQKEYDEMIKRLNPSKIFVYQSSDKEWLNFRGRNIEKVKMFSQTHWNKGVNNG